MMRITPALIPHADFHTGTWLLPVSRPEWYYFLDRKSRNIISNKDFLKSVDKPLRRLVKWLYEKRIKTTASCSGHHISERNLQKIYSGLEKDGEEIRNGGLHLKDIETGRLFVFRDYQYDLPWSKQNFVDEVSVYQQTGIIGLRLGNRKKLKAKVLKTFAKISLPGVKAWEEDSVIFILTNEEKSGNNRKTWKKITRILRRSIE